MKILAFDTSSKYLSIACLEDEKAVVSFHEDMGIRHSEVLIPRIKELLGKAGWDIPDVDLVCVGIGPGSFTGLRIGVATVKGLAAVLKNKVIGVPSMDAIVRNLVPRDAKVAPFFDARKGKVYSCIYDIKGNEVNRQTEYLLLTVDELLGKTEEKILFFGDAVEKYKEELEAHPNAGHIEDVDWYPNAVEIGRLGYQRAAKGTDDPETLEPLYLHAKECNITTKKGMDT